MYIDCIVHVCSLVNINFYNTEKTNISCQSSYIDPVEPDRSSCITLPDGDGECEREMVGGNVLTVKSGV